MAAQAAGAQTIEKIKVERPGAKFVLPVEIHLPKGATGKLPAMIIMHGSSGVRAVRELAYARKFNELGIAAVVIDSFTPRGVRTTVSQQASVTEREMLGDVLAVLKTVARRPDIDPVRIGLIGFSKGGSVTIKAALRNYMKDAGDARFGILIALYPWCGEMPIDFSSSGAPLLMMLGGKDTYVGTASCREYAQKFQAAGGKLTLKVYDDGRHGWDVPGSTAWTDRQAQNASQCVYEEIQPGKWIERKTGLTTFDRRMPTADARKARAMCGTIGASGGYDAATAKHSFEEITSAVRDAFAMR